MHKKIFCLLIILSFNFIPAFAGNIPEGTYTGKANVTGFGGVIKYDLAVIVANGHITAGFFPPEITEDRRPVLHDFVLGTHEQKKYIKYKNKKINIKIAGFAKSSKASLKISENPIISDFSLFANKEIFSDYAEVCSEGAGTIINIAPDGNAILGFNTAFPIVTNPDLPLVQDQVLFGMVNNDGTFEKVNGSLIDGIETNISMISQDDEFIYFEGIAGYPENFSIKFSKNACDVE